MRAEILPAPSWRQQLGWGVVVWFGFVGDSRRRCFCTYEFGNTIRNLLREERYNEQENARIHNKTTFLMTKNPFVMSATAAWRGRRNRQVISVKGTIGDAHAHKPPFPQAHASNQSPTLSAIATGGRNKQERTHHTTTRQAPTASHVRPFKLEDQRSSRAAKTLRPAPSHETRWCCGVKIFSRMRLKFAAQS